MIQLTKTKRSYTDKETGKKYDLFMDQTDNYHLLNGPDKIKAFYICAHTGATIKLNTGKKIDLNPGEFYTLKDGEQVTARKFVGFNKFVKL